MSYIFLICCRETSSPISLVSGRILDSSSFPPCGVLWPLLGCECGISVCLGGPCQSTLSSGCLSAQERLLVPFPTSAPDVLVALGLSSPRRFLLVRSTCQTGLEAVLFTWPYGLAPQLPVQPSTDAMQVIQLDGEELHSHSLLTAALNTASTTRCIHEGLVALTPSALGDANIPCAAT